MEIYLEKVKDLLAAESNHVLRVRENTHTGPYVEGLTSHAVNDFTMVNQLMNEGSKVRSEEERATQRWDRHTLTPLSRCEL